MASSTEIEGNATQETENGSLFFFILTIITQHDNDCNNGEMIRCSGPCRSALWEENRTLSERYGRKTTEILAIVRHPPLDRAIVCCYVPLHSCYNNIVLYLECTCLLLLVPPPHASKLRVRCGLSRMVVFEILSWFSKRSFRVYELTLWLHFRKTDDFNACQVVVEHRQGPERSLCAAAWPILTYFIPKYTFNEVWGSFR